MEVLYQLSSLLFDYFFILIFIYCVDILKLPITYNVDNADNKFSIEGYFIAMFYAIKVVQIINGVINVLGIPTAIKFRFHLIMKIILV